MCFSFFLFANLVLSVNKDLVDAPDKMQLLFYKTDGMMGSEKEDYRKEEKAWIGLDI
jgi:hypothetical protein